jgi:hypothetical protein
VTAAIRAAALTSTAEWIAGRYAFATQTRISRAAIRLADQRARSRSGRRRGSRGGSRRRARARKEPRFHHPSRHVVGVPRTGGRVDEEEVATAEDRLPPEIEDRLFIIRSPRHPAIGIFPFERGEHMAPGRRRAGCADLHGGHGFGIRGRAAGEEEHRCCPRNTFGARIL